MENPTCKHMESRYISRYSYLISSTCIIYRNKSKLAMQRVNFSRNFYDQFRKRFQQYLEMGYYFFFSSNYFMERILLSLPIYLINYF